MISTGGKYVALAKTESPMRDRLVGNEARWMFLIAGSLRRKRQRKKRTLAKNVSLIFRHKFLQRKEKKFPAVY